MTVTLVGAGPGDPGLITVRGLERLRALRRASSTTASSRTSSSTRHPPTRCGSAGTVSTRRRSTGCSSRSVGELDVVRLKGGDPFVFGRGGEEALALAEAGVPFEVVPGVSSLAAVPAAAGIPVTHRGLSDRVTIATAHAADGAEPDYAQLAAAGGTLVLFMGLGRLSAARRRADRSRARRPTRRRPSSPAARCPTRRRRPRRSRRSRTRSAGLPGPALVIVGDVVALAGLLSPTLATLLA